jgi:hypothetical protein
VSLSLIDGKGENGHEKGTGAFMALISHPVSPKRFPLNGQYGLKK